MPDSGTIAGNMSQQYEVVVQPRARGAFSATLTCVVGGGLHVPLVVNGVVGAVDFRIEAASINFGLLRSGTAKSVLFSLQNFADIKVQWKRVQSQHGHCGSLATSLSLSPEHGTLSPHGSDDITVGYALSLKVTTSHGLN